MNQIHHILKRIKQDRKFRIAMLSVAGVVVIALVVLVTVVTVNQKQSEQTAAEQMAAGQKTDDQSMEQESGMVSETQANDAEEENSDQTAQSESDSETASATVESADNSGSEVITVTSATDSASEDVIATSVSSNGYQIQTINGITYVDGVLIANKTYGLPSDYAPGDILSEVKAAYQQMQQAAAAEGLNIYISSGYRSYSTQNRIYNNYVSKDGVALADTYSARPGHSEHQTGLCFDLNTIDDSFANTPESAWLEVHAQEYGFIIRYPLGKENVTGYQYEPWHLRYLGVDLATSVYNSGLSLEEYYGITSSY